MENAVIDSGSGQGIINDTEIKGYLNETARWTKFYLSLGS